VKLHYRLYALMLAALMIAGCTRTIDRPVIQDRVTEVRVPVVAECREGEHPVEPTPLNQRFTREQWYAMTTDQRENLQSDQALARKIYADQLAAHTAGCR